MQVSSTTIGSLFVAVATLTADRRNATWGKGHYLLPLVNQMVRACKAERMPGAESLVTIRTWDDYLPMPTRS